jgi:hypothetical protein
MNPISAGINHLMSNTMVRITTILFINRLLGATLTPMPAFLSKLFGNWIFKYICLVLVGIVAKHPLVDGAMTEVFIAAAIVLGITYAIYELAIHYKFDINIINPLKFLCPKAPTNVKSMKKNKKNKKPVVSNFESEFEFQLN